MDRTLDKNNVAIHLHIAHQLIRAGHPQEALLRLNAVLRSDPQNTVAWYLLARALQDPRKKLYAFQRALRSDPWRIFMSCSHEDWSRNVSKE